MLRTKQAASYTYCLTAQDVTDQKAKALHGRSKQNEADLQILLFKFAEKLAEIPQQQWQELTSKDEIQPILFSLNEMRQQVLDKLSSAQEELIDDLAVEGYHSWMSLYTTLIRRMQIPFEQDGKVELYSVERLDRVFSSPDRQEREQAFIRYTEAFRGEEEVFANILNNMTGFRLKMYKHRGWNSVLQESLGLNRMSQPTLEAMWAAVTRSRENFSRYFKRKAELLGLDKMSWFDVHTSVGSSSSVLPFTDGVNFILERFRGFSPLMAEFAVKAFDEKWVETEDRPNKSPVGFHAGYPLIKQSRIFKAYYGTAHNVATLAHELGHAYHQSLINEMPPLAQKYGLNLAETASILSESLVMNGLIQQEMSRDEQIALLDAKIKMSAEYFFNVYTCYLFEKSLYAERVAGPLSPQRLSELMVEAQKAAYGDVYEVYNPYFWASKFHLYITRHSFFNFPYTFGFLFSTGIYAQSMEAGREFEHTYANLLRESASMTVEQLAAKHLGVDLQKVEFWENAVKLVTADIDQFLGITEDGR
nr:M3 family oligoendopeptidase [Paenibacillus pasadenensis]